MSTPASSTASLPAIPVIFDSPAQRAEFFAHLDDLATLGCPMTTNFRDVIDTFSRGMLKEEFFKNGRVLDGYRGALKWYVGMYAPRALKLVRTNDWGTFAVAMTSEMV